jgi:hypothetical protein
MQQLLALLLFYPLMSTGSVVLSYIFLLLVIDVFVVLVGDWGLN